MSDSTPANNEQTYGILCHRQFADRIRDALLRSDSSSWRKLSCSGEEETRVAQSSQEVADQYTKKYEIISTPEEKGPRKSRTGFVLMVIQGAVISPAALPPMARKQMSWVGKLTHQIVLNDGTNCKGTAADGALDLQTAMKLVFDKIWTELSTSFDLESGYLRVDVQPKSFNTEVCDTITSFINGLGQGPKIKMACSASKVSHVVNITIQSTSSPDTQQPIIQKVYWGISRNKDHFEDLNQKLNDYATNEVILESTCSKTGVDSNNSNNKSNTVRWDAPVSRAYYKLSQVFEDDNLLQLIASLHNNNKSKHPGKKSVLSHGAGLDIGASPGGWTQVLRNTLGLPTVVAIDPGIIAQRVMALKGVHHLHTELSTDVSIKGLAHHAPYSTIVCDASISNANELLVKILETLEKVSTLLKKDHDDGNPSTTDGNALALPFCLVITLKLPYKTVGSIDRNIEKVNNYLPNYLRRFARLGSSSGNSDADDVNCQYRICHLFANSVSERTLVAVFDKK